MRHTRAFKIVDACSRVKFSCVDPSHFSRSKLESAS